MATDLSSITAGANYLAAQPTPAANLANYLANQSAMQTNQIQQQNYLAQKAVGQAEQAATDPVTGQLDTGKASILISQNPDAAPLADKAISNIYQTRIQQMGLNSAQQDQMIKSTGLFANNLTSLIAQGQVAAQKSGNPSDANITLPQVTGALTNIFTAGGFGDPTSQTAKQAVTALVSQLPTTTPELQTYIHTHSQDMQNWHAQLQQNVTGQANDVDDGTNINPSMRNLNTGVNTPSGPGFQIGPTRAALAAPVQTGNLPDTTPTYSSTGSVLSRGGAPMGGAGGYMGGAPGSQQAPVFTGNGSYPQQSGGFGGPGTGIGPGASPAGPAPAPPGQSGPPPSSMGFPASSASGQGAPAAPPPVRMMSPPPQQPLMGPPQGQMAPQPQQGVPAPPQQPWTMGMSPQQLAASQQGMSAGVTQFKADQAAIPAQKAGLANAQQALQGLVTAGPTGTGPGTAGLNSFKSAYGQFAGALSGFGVNLPGGAAAVQSAASYDDLHKLLVANASQMAASAGPHSNEGLAAAVSGNASTSISNLASQDVLKTQIALARMKQFPALSYVGSPDAQGDTTGSNYPGYAAKVATTMDPRAFLFDLLNTSQRAKVIASLSPPGTPPKVVQANQLRFYDDVVAAQRVSLVAQNGQAPATTFAPGQ